MGIRSRHATLSEVAKMAGVGTTTVSRVINESQRVDPKTRARVRKVIEKLGYTPNQAARILRGDRTKTIGLLVPSIADPFFARCAEAAQAIVRANDSLLIVVATQNDPHTEIENVDVLMRHRADGLVITPANSQSQSLREVIQRLPVPVVAMDRPLSGSRVPSVVADNFNGAIMATKHLIDHGRKRIVALPGNPHSSQFANGFEVIEAAINPPASPVSWTPRSGITSLLNTPSRACLLERILPMHFLL